MKDVNITSEELLASVVAAKNRNWDIRVDPRHNPEGALAAIKLAHLAPLQEASADAKPMAEDTHQFLPTKVLRDGVNAPFRFRLKGVKSGVPRKRLPQRNISHI